MKALGKILGLLALGLLLTLVALGFFLTYQFNPNDYKEQIRQLAREQMGLELNIDGDIGWSLFPWLGLRLQDTSLASVRTPEQPFASLRRLDLSVQVMPLLHQELRMRAIRLDGLELSLLRDEQGVANWEGIGKAATPPKVPAIEAPVEPMDDSLAPAETAEVTEEALPLSSAPQPLAHPPLVLDIHSLVANDARISYQDARTGQQLSAEHLSFNLGAIREGVAIPLHLKTVLSSRPLALHMQTELQGQLYFDLAAKRYRFDGLRLNGELTGEPLKGTPVSANLQGELLVDLAEGIAEWKGLKVNLNQVRGLAELRLQNLGAEPVLSGTLSVARIDLVELMGSLDRPLPAMADGNALHNVELMTKLSGGLDHLVLDDLDLGLDGSHLKGRVAINSFSKRLAQLNIKGDYLDLDRYLPPLSQREQDSRAERKTEQEALRSARSDSPLPERPERMPWGTAELLPLQPLRQWNAQLQLSLSQLNLGRVPLDNLSLKAQLTAGQLKLDELHVQLEGGQLEATASLDLRPELPLLAIQGHLKEVPVEKLFGAHQALVPVSGLLSLTTQLNTSGNSPQAWINGLSGPLELRIDKGQLLQASLEPQLCRAIALVHRKPLSTELRAKDSAFRELRANLLFKQGVATNPDLKISVPGLLVKGSGDIDLRVLGMDYRLGLQLEGDKREMPDPACQVNRRLVSIDWPLHCRGPLSLAAAACRVDQDSLSRLAGYKVSDKPDEKPGDKLSPEFKNILKGLFDR